MTVQQRGGSKTAAGAAAVGTGAVEVLTEFLPMSYLVDKFGKTGFKDFLAGELLRELPGEQIATFAQDAIDTAADNPDTTWSQFWAERPEAAMATVVSVAVQSGSLGGLSVAARRLQRDTNAAANAQATQQFAKQLDEIAAASKVRERDPSSFENFINSAAEDTPVEHVYVAATDLAQTIQDAGENAPQLINELSAIPSIAGQLSDMLAAGGDIKVPVGEWAAYAAGSELSQQLLPHLRTNPFDMSMRQAEEFLQTQGETLKAQVQQAIDVSAQQSAFATSSEAVRAHFADQLKGVNRFTSDVNDLYAQLLQAWYTTSAQRAGVTPEDMLAKYPLKIQAQGVAAEALTQPKTNANGYVRVEPDAQGFLTLSHWSDKGRLKQLDPEMWGENWEVLPDEEKVRVGDAPGRVYWGVGTGQAGQYQPEYGIGNHRYEAKIEASKLYDIDKDPLKLRRQAQANIKAGMDKGEKLADYAEDITTEFEKLIQAAGFAGYQSHSNQIGHVAAVFEPLKHTYKGRWAEALAQAPVPAVGGQASIDDFTPEALPDLLTKDGWALLTAENPAKRTDVGPEDNARLNAELIAELERRGIEYHPVEGHYGQRENSFIAFTDEATALELGALFGQESVLNRRGLLYMDGTIDPAVGVTVHDTRPEDFYTYVPETDALFTIDIAFAEGARPVDTARALAQESMPAAVRRAPTPAKLLGDLRRSAEGELRGMLDPEGNLFTWDAAEGTHTEGAARLGIPYDNERRVWVSLEDGLPKVSLPAGVRPPAAYLRSDDVLFDAGSRGVITGREYAAELGQATDKAPRGSFNPSTLTITLLKDADLSTFLHETGHFFLEAFADMAKSGDPALTADWAEAAKFMGFEGMAPDVWLGLPLDQRRDGHERWARGFEAYLFEGKPPAAGLRGAFQKFRSWLLAVYKQLTGLNVELTPEVRGVFDRMLAAGNEIALYEEAQSYAPLFKSAEEAGMTKEEWEAYQELGAEATQTAAEALQARSLRDMQWLSRARDRTVARLQREAKEKRKAIRQEVTAEVMDQPINRVRTFLKRGLVNGEKVEGPTKLDLERVKALYAHLPKELQDFTKLGYGKYGMLAKEGVDPDVVADMFGFTSGHELVEALLNAPDPREEIAGLTDQRMLERYGDLADKGSIDRAADEAIHNDARLKFVATEANALAKAAGTARVLAAAARDFARQAVARQKVRDLRPSRFGGAEVRSAREAAAAAAKGDLVAAATAKRNQLVNGYAAKAAADARAEVEKAVRYFATLQKEGTRKAIDPDYLDQVDALLDRFDLRRGVSLKAIDKRKSLLEWVEAQKAMGLTPVVPDELLDEAKRKHYRDLTVEELRGIVDSVRNIVHLGRLKRRLLNEREKRTLDQVTNALADSIAANAVGPARRELENNTLVAAVKSGVREFFAMHRKLASLARQMDGLRDGGPMWQAIIRPMNEAGDREATMREAATIELGKLFEPLLKAGGLKDKVFIKEIDASLSLEGRLAVALNWGNETNRARIMDGDGWSQEQVDAILRTLSPEHFAFVQKVWDYVDTYWPQIAAKERRVTGIEPEKVERDPVTVTANDGSQITLDGGYYPIKYDPRRSGRSEGDSLAEVLKQRMEGASLRATTRRGHTKARAEKVSRPVLKEFSVLFGHVNDVIHDLAWHEFLIDANRILRSDVVDQSIRGFLSPEVAKAIRLTLDDIAVGDTPAANVFERSVNYLRSGATIAGLGWNLTTALLQPLGLSQSIVRIGPKWVARGVSRIFRDASSLNNTAAWVNERSEFMRLRAKTMQREISELRNRIRTVKPEALTAVEETYFFMIAKMQLVADLPTWVGQYEKAMAGGADEAEAAALADQAVLDSQGGGQIKDLAGVQRGNVLMKLWTNFYSFFNVTYNQLAESAYLTRKLGPSRTPAMAADVLLLLVVPSIMGTALRMAISGDDWEDFWAKAAKDEAGYLFGLMVGLREFGSILSSDGSYSSLAGLRFLNDANKLVAQAKQGEADGAFWKALSNTAGVLLHYPAGQVNRTVSGISALANGETRNPLVVVTGPPKN